jgi:hypothetical protein
MTGRVRGSRMSSGGSVKFTRLLSGTANLAGRADNEKDKHRVPGVRSSESRILVLSVPFLPGSTPPNRTDVVNASWCQTSALRVVKIAPDSERCLGSSIHLIGRVIKVSDFINELRLQKADDVLRFPQTFAELGVRQEAAHQMERLWPRRERGPGDLADKLVISAVRANEIQFDVEIGLHGQKVRHPQQSGVDGRRMFNLESRDD